jgi:cystathionine beta-lyase
MKANTRLMQTPDLALRPTRTVNPELHRGSTVLFDSYADLQRAGQGTYPGVTYGTDRLPQQRVLEQALAELEGAALTRVFPSGISAISETLLAFVQAGDHLLVCDNAYGPTLRFCREVLARFGVQTETIPANTGADIASFLRPNTRLIFLESPGSNTFEIQDIPAITHVARERGIITVLDNTWATPLFLDPFALGVDISIHSVTKYLSGHSDVLMGSASTTPAHAETLARAYACREIYASPEDCLLTLRGLKTLHVRMKEHFASALLVAERLQAHPLVRDVLHPALPTHPEHHLWQRDFSGASGLFGLTLCHEYAPEALGVFLDSLRLFGMGYSWGGYKSLVTAGVPARTLAGRHTGQTIIRLHIGLENPQDLLEDLLHGLALLEGQAPRGEN